MQHTQVVFTGDCTVLTGNASSQAAVMVIAPGASEGGSDNRHKGSDQWLYVAGGEGSATINGSAYPLHAGTLLLIEKGETHEIRNEGKKPLYTLNFYVPPAYAANGAALPAGDA
jgi:mannose-6-phosphate isomerase-like protein (cupin superfamily)